MKKIYDSRFQLGFIEIIKGKSDISQIIGELFSYNDARELLKEFKKNGIISDLSGEVELTKIGEDYRRELLKEIGIVDKKPFIIPQYKYFSRKMDKFDIYLRNRDIPR